MQKIALSAKSDFVGEPHRGLPDRAATVGRPYKDTGVQISCDYPVGNGLKPFPTD